MKTPRKFGKPILMICLIFSYFLLSSCGGGTNGTADIILPTAVLEIATSVESGDSFLLTGKKSTDVPPGQIKKYFWKRNNGDGGSQLDSSIETTTSSLEVTDVIALGTHQFQLIVEDQAGNQSSPSLIDVTIHDTTQPNAVFDIPGVVEAGSDLLLDGNASSDVGAGVIEKYIWKRMSGAGVNNLDSPVNRVTPTLKVPGFLELGVHQFQLTVEDQSGNQSLPVLKSVDVQDTTPPTAVLDSVDGVETGVSFVLSAKRSVDIAPGQIAKYIWQRISGPGSGNLDAQTETIEQTLEVTDITVVGIHQFRLIVEDQSGNQSLPVLLDIEVNDSIIPTAVLNTVNSVDVGTSFILSGKFSSDVPPGQIVKYIWQRMSGPGSSILDASIETTESTYEVTDVTAAGTHQFQLIVEDQTGNLSFPSLKNVEVISNPLANWSTPTTLGDTDKYVFFTFDTPIVHTDANGNAVAIWDRSGSPDEIRASLYDATQKSWGAEIVITSGEVGSLRTFDLAVASDGNAIVVWAEYSSTDKRSYLYSRYYDVNTGWDVDAVALNIGSNINSPSFGHVVFDSSGDAIASWSISKPSGSSRVSRGLAVAVYNPVTSLWSAETTLEEHAADPNRVLEKGIVSDVNGNTYVTWWGTDGTNDYMRLASFDGVNWSSATTLQSITNSITQPSIAVAGNGDVMVIWTEGITDGVRLSTSRYDFVDGTFDAVATVTDVMSTKFNPGPLEKPHFAMDLQGNAAVVWVQHDDTGLFVQGANYDLNGGTGWETSTLVGPHNGETIAGGDFTIPRIASTGTQSFIAVWHTTSPALNSTAVYANYYSLSSGWPSSPEPIFDTNDDQLGFPGIASSGNGDAVITGVTSPMTNNSAGTAWAMEYNNPN